MLVRSLSVALLALWICGPGGQSAHAADVDTQRDLVNGGVVGLVSGGVTGTYIRIAADLADALDDGYQMRVLPIIGKGSVRNSSGERSEWTMPRPAVIRLTSPGLMTISVPRLSR